jgi:hypothetical protein
MPVHDMGAWVFLWRGAICFWVFYRWEASIAKYLRYGFSAFSYFCRLEFLAST